MTGARNDRATEDIEATPSKSFFIEMLTRDIGLIECIFDLVDNSLHGAIRAQRVDATAALLAGLPDDDRVRAHVALTVNRDLFQIEDDAGGIGIGEATNEVFVFGKPSTAGEFTALGVYGIGMKRAVFKLGNDISVFSRTEAEEIEVPIKVRQWRDEPGWTLRFAYAGPWREGNGLGPGTIITVQDLHPGVARTFELDSFLNELRRRLGRTYSLFLKIGVDIRLNGEAIDPALPAFATSETLQPVRHRYTDEGIDIVVLCGVTPRADRTAHGWYVFCNGRLVLDADKSRDTGWGDRGGPNWNPKYNHFLGIVYFGSNDASKLPWTTTKDDVDRESAVYQRALGQMRVLSRPVLKFLSDLYAPSGESTDDALKPLDTAQTIAPEQLAAVEERTFLAPPVLRPPRTDTLISYRREIDRVERVKGILGRGLTNKAIGEATFDYFESREVPSE